MCTYFTQELVADGKGVESFEDMVFYVKHIQNNQNKIKTYTCTLFFDKFEYYMKFV